MTYIKMPYNLVLHHIHPCAPPQYDSIPVLSTSLLCLLPLVLQRSSSDAGAVDLPLVCCCADGGIKILYTPTYYTPSPPAVQHCLTRSPGAVPLLTSCHVCCPYSPLAIKVLAYGVLFVSSVNVWSRSLSFS